MTLLIEAFVLYKMGTMVLKIHNDFMRKWNLARAEGRL